MTNHKKLTCRDASCDVRAMKMTGSRFHTQLHVVRVFVCTSCACDYVTGSFPLDTNLLLLCLCLRLGLL